MQGPLERRLGAVVEEAPLASLAVAAVADGEVTCAGAWGWQRIDAAHPLRSVPATLDTKFRVASISKLVTSLGALRLVEQGTLQLDRDISTYLGFRLRNPAFADRPITARMLLSHTSSLRDANFYNVPPPHTLADLFHPAGAYYAGGAHFARPLVGANTGPGHYFTYANLNFGVLATAMEGATGERFDRLMRRLVLQPLAIDGGYLLADLSRQGQGQVATLYTRQDASGAWDVDGPWRAQFDAGGAAPGAGAAQGARADAALLRAYRPGSNGTLFSPHAGLRISARDLAKVMVMLLDEGRYGGRQMLNPGTVRRLWAEQWRYDAPQGGGDRGSGDRSNGGNGDIGNGLLRAWGLGVQHTTGSWDDWGGDRLAGSERTFWGHRGEAYGFLGGLWLDPAHKVGFVYLIGGLGDDPLRHPGLDSSFNRWEELIQAALLEEPACGGRSDNVLD